jgi:hypothetical protein
MKMMRRLDILICSMGVFAIAAVVVILTAFVPFREQPHCSKPISVVEKPDTTYYEVACPKGVIPIGIRDTIP